MTWLISLGVLLAIALVLAQLLKKAPADDEAMGRITRLVLMSYLLTLGVLLVYTVTKLTALEYPDAPVMIEAPGEQDVTALSKLPGPALFYAMAHLTPGTPSTYELALYGVRFQKDAKVRLNGQLHGAKSLNADSLIRVVPENKVLIGTSALVAEVVNPDGVRSNALVLRVDRPRMPLSAFGEHWTITREVHLLLLVLCAGALGTFVHIAGSLADYIGNRTSVSSWFWWYVSRPFVGSAMALIFYAVLRGGFLTGTAADARVVNPFGAMAVASLVGMFSDKASQKLKEVFETLFKSDDKRVNKLAAPVISKLVPPTVGTGKPADVRIVGERLGKASGVTVNGAERKADKIDEKEVLLKLTADDTKNVGDLKIAVVTDAGSSPSVILHVSDLEIATDKLPAGKVGTDYAGQLQATGGTQPLTWTVDSAPGGLKIDATSGAMTGKPTKPGATKTTITVTDQKSASVAREYDIEIAP